jgi:hypothetical protein
MLGIILRDVLISLGCCIASTDGVPPCRLARKLSFSRPIVAVPFCRLPFAKMV